MTSKHKLRIESSPRTMRSWSRRLTLAAVGAVALAACASRPAPLSQPATPKPAMAQGDTVAAARPAGLGVTRLKRRVYVLEHAATTAAADDRFVATAGVSARRADERAVALRTALERALAESGRYEVAKVVDRRSFAADADTDALRMSVELLDNPHLTTVRLHIHDPRSSSPAIVFSGEGVTLEYRTGVFSRADEERARAGALNFAVTKALRNASAVLGALPWQAPVMKATDDNTVLIPGGRRLGLKPGVVLSIQTRERVLQGTRAPVAVPGRLVGEVLIVDNVDGPERESMALGTVVSGSLKGYDMRELVARVCRPNGYFGHDFGHDRQCSAKAAALVSFDPETALMSFSPDVLAEGELLAVPDMQPMTSPPSAVF